MLRCGNEIGTGMRLGRGYGGEAGWRCGLEAGWRYGNEAKCYVHALYCMHK